MFVNRKRLYLPLTRRLCFRQCLFVCLSASNIAQKVINGRIMNVSGSLGNDTCTKNSRLNFGSDLDHHADCPLANLIITQ